MHGDEVVETNLFCEGWLVVGEVMVAVEDEVEAVSEVSQLLIWQKTRPNSPIHSNGNAGSR